MRQSACIAEPVLWDYGGKCMEEGGLGKGKGKERDYKEPGVMAQGMSWRVMI